MEDLKTPEEKQAERMKQLVEDGLVRDFDEAKKEIEIEDFPEKFKQLYSFTGPENGGFIFTFLNGYQSADKQKRINMIKFFTNESVINYVKVFSDNLRKEYQAVEGTKVGVDRWMAHRSESIQSLVYGMSQENPDELIAMIQKTGMDKENAIYDPEKYYDIKDIINGIKLEGYNK